MAFVSPISDRSREREQEAITAGANLAMVEVNGRMAVRISESGPTYQASEIYEPEWWDDAADTYIALALAVAIERYGLETARNLGIPIPTLRGTTWAVSKATLLDAQMSAVKGYNDTILSRVSQSTNQANEEDWDDPQLAAHLGLTERGITALEVATLLPPPPGGSAPTVPASSVQPGPLSPGIAEGIGTTEAHTAAEGTAFGVGQATGLVGFKIWDTSFVNSRQTHQDANGQSVPIEDFFIVGGEFAEYPGDWGLSAAERINCACSTGFEYAEADRSWLEEPTTLREDQLEARRETIEARVDSRQTTKERFNERGADGKGWDAERVRVHNQILDDVWERKALSVPNDGEVIFSGGMGGAGKGTTLASDAAGIDQTRFLELNADAMKEELARRGLIPIGEGLTQMEGAALVHKESSYLADRLAERAYAEKKNIIWDTTMRDAAKTGKQIDTVIAAGYQQPRLVFVDIPVEVSVKRALERHQRGLEEFLSGKEGALGGRYVPPNVIRDLAGTRLESVNLEAFEQLIADKDVFWQLFNNAVDGRDPVLIAEGLTGVRIDEILRGWKPPT
jgi:hypothetical protein